MKKFKLFVKNAKKLNHIVLLDGKYVKPNKHEDGAYIINTDKNFVNVQIFSVRPLQSKAWFITSPLLFLISLFGLFNLGKKDKLHSVEFEADFFFNQTESAETVEINLDEQTEKKEENIITEEKQTTLTAYEFKDGETAFLMNTNANCQIRTNKFFIDLKLKKRRKFARLINLLLTLAIIVAVVLLIVL